MKTHHLRSLFLAPFAAACLLLTTARAEDAAATVVKFSDPSKPGTLKINLGRGDLRVSGADTTEVSVKSNARNSDAPKRKDGLRVLTSSSSFSVGEKDNTVTLDASNMSRGNSDYAIVVPRNTAIIVQNMISGDISTTGIDGDIEVSATNGDLKFDEVGGGVIASTTNGEINVSLRELREGKPLSLTSISGEVEVRLPASTKANVRFRTQNGEVLTDFDPPALVTKTENSPTASARFRGRTITRTSNGVVSEDVRIAIEDATRVAVESAQEVAAAVKAGADAARADIARSRSAYASASTSASQIGERGDRMVPPTPPIPPIPTITGGKLVTGTLNGGGPEISVATMNGDIVFRQK